MAGHASSILGFVAVGLSGASAFGLAYWGYRPIADWLLSRADADAVKYRAWTNELFVPWSPEEIRKYALMARIAIIVSAVLAFLLFRSALLAAATAYAVSMLPGQVYRILRLRRLDRLEKQLPDAVSVLVSSVRAGSALSTAIRDVSEKISGPVGQEFSLVEREQRVAGLSLEAALERAEATVPVDGFKMISSALAVSSREGGDLLKVLERMANALRELARLKQKIVTETSEVRAQQKVIVAMTPAFGGLLCLFDPSIPDILFHSIAGNVVLIVVVVIQVGCIFWIRGIVKSTI